MRFVNLLEGLAELVRVGASDGPRRERAGELRDRDRVGTVGDLGEEGVGVGRFDGAQPDGAQRSIEHVDRHRAAVTRLHQLPVVPSRGLPRGNLGAELLADDDKELGGGHLLREPRVGERDGGDVGVVAKLLRDALFFIPRGFNRTLLRGANDGHDGLDVLGGLHPGMLREVCVDGRGVRGVVRGGRGEADPGVLRRLLRRANRFRPRHGPGDAPHLLNLGQKAGELHGEPGDLGVHDSGLLGGRRGVIVGENLVGEILKRNLTPARGVVLGHQGVDILRPECQVEVMQGLNHRVAVDEALVRLVKDLKRLSPLRSAPRRFSGELLAQNLLDVIRVHGLRRRDGRRLTLLDTLTEPVDEVPLRLCHRGVG